MSPEFNGESSGLGRVLCPKEESFEDTEKLEGVEDPRVRDGVVVPDSFNSSIGV